jgi:flagellar basal-body rod modification protein FlgD
MDISNITSASGGTNFLDPEQATRTTGKQSLDVNDFLKLITVQLTSQDPMKPMEDTQFISQMASFTSLEQMKTLSENFAAFSSEQRLSAAQDFLGKVVTVSTNLGEVSGEVTRVTLEDGAPRLSIGAGIFDPADVTSITAKPALTIPSTQPN